MKEIKTDDKFFDWVESVLPRIEDSDENIELIEDFLKKYLNVDDLDDSIIAFETVSSRIFIYFLLSFLVHCEDHRKEIVNYSDNEDGNSKLYYVHIGKFEPSLKMLDKEVNFCDSDLQEIGVDLGKDSLIVFPYNKTESALKYVKRVIQDLEKMNVQG